MIRKWFAGKVFYSFVPILLLGKIFFCTNIKEDVSFELTGEGSATIQLNLIDVDNAMAVYFNTKPYQLIAPLDSTAESIQKALQAKVQKPKCAFDGEHKLLNISFRFNTPEELNAAMALFCNTDQLYQFTKANIQRKPNPLFFGSDSIKTAGSLADKNCYAYHSYRLHIGMPAGAKKIKLDNPDAFLRHSGEIVEIEREAKSCTNEKGLDVNIQYKP